MVSTLTTSMQITEIKTSSSSSTYILQFEKSISYIKRKRTVQYFKYRTESFDDYYYFPFTKKKKKRCKLYHVINWLSMFADIHNKLIQNEMMMFLS
jgi:hypothetical protein